jgi:hypothetical protein
MVIFFVWIGFYPNTFLSISERSTRAVVGVVEQMKGENRYAADANVRVKDPTVKIPVINTALPVGGDTLSMPGAVPQSGPVSIPNPGMTNPPGQGIVTPNAPPPNPSVIPPSGR